MNTLHMRKNGEFTKYFPMILGFIIVTLSLIPAIVLGDKGQVTLHDQLDGEVLGYILNARNFMEPVFLEFMNGMSSTSLTPPSWGTVLLYIIFSPFNAFLANYILVSIFAFLGMYLLVNEITQERWTSAIVAVLFSQIPFYSVYGLSVMGQPLVFYACLRLVKGKSPWISFVTTTVFALFSSLVLVGYADCLFLVCTAMYLQIRRHPSAPKVWIQALILIGIYVLLNWPLLQQILFSSGAVSHKNEIVPGYQKFVDAFTNIFTKGQYHAESMHSGLVAWTCAMTFVYILIFPYCTETEREKFFVFGILVMSVVTIAVIYALWNCLPVVELRSRLGGVFLTFQLDRFYWLYPMLWFLIFGYIVHLILFLTQKSNVQKVCGWISVAILISNMGSSVYESSVLKKNLATMQNENYASPYVCWEEFYSEDLFTDIKTFIGRPQEEYRVASVALYPAIPLYNGFYCIDGYSNNYSLDYKHAFREIIEQEIKKSDWMHEYFDNWGNRCYIFSSELEDKYFFTRGSAVIENLELSAAALKNLNCSYIMSGVEIKNAADSGLRLLKTFEHKDSWYRIHLYEVI